MHWAQVVFGWPTALGAIVLSVFGLLRVTWWLVALGATLALPSMFYVWLLTPLVAVPVVAGHWLAVFALWKDRIVTAWLLFTPALVVTALFVLVATR